MRDFHKRLGDATLGLMPRGSTVVCAVSGGADSIALLRGLCAVNDLRDCGWALHVAHLDHQLREGSGADAAFVQETAASLRLDCSAEQADVRAAARTAGESVEEAARRVRYGFLERVAHSTGAGVVAVGHHADDQVETVLHRICRGTGLRGLAGMRHSRPIRNGSDVQLVRPLLGFRRAELLEYLNQRACAYREDPTNADTHAATRNRIRHQVLPLLRDSVNPELSAALLRLATQARRADEAARYAAAEVLNRAQVHRTNDTVILDAEAVAVWPEAIRAEIILAVLRRLGVGLKHIGFERIEAAASAACGGGAHRCIELPGGVTVERRDRELLVRAGTLPSQSEKGQGHASHSDKPFCDDEGEGPCR